MKLTKKQKAQIIKIWNENKDKNLQVKTKLFNNIEGTTFDFSTLAKYYNFYMDGFNEGIKKSASETQLERMGKARANLMLKQKENMYARREFHTIARKSVITEQFKKELMVAYKEKNKYSLGKYKDPIDTQTAMLVINSDLQIGREVNMIDNIFNEKVLMERQNIFLNKVKKYAKMFKVNQFIHLDMGDAIDHNSMRPGHYNDLEPNLFAITKQYKKWIDFRMETLNAIDRFGKVKFAGVPSNHCRINGDKALNHPIDDWSILHNDTIDRLLPNSELKLNPIDYKNGIYHFNILGQDIYLSHSDKLPGKPNVHKNNWVNHLKTNYGIKNVDLLITGHYHHTFINDNHFGIGSIVGKDDYAAKLGLGARPAQGIVLITKDTITCIPIYLD